MMLNSSRTPSGYVNKSRMLYILKQIEELVFPLALLWYSAEVVSYSRNMLEF